MIDEEAHDYNNTSSLDDDSNKSEPKPTEEKSSSSNSSAYTPMLGLESDQQSKLNATLNVYNDLAKSGMGNFNSAMGKMRSISINKAFNKIKGRKKTGGIIKQLIDLIFGILTLPIRFAHVGASIATGSAALAMSIDGLGKSVALAGEDLYILIITIATIIAKYFLCLISFIITTIGGCSLIHVFSFVASVGFLIFPITSYGAKITLGVNLDPHIDSFFESIYAYDDHLSTYTGFFLTRWPKMISSICHTCFGKNVKLKDILVDVWSIKTVGDMISYDFSVRMPGYMKRSAPLSKISANSLKKATGPM